MVRIELLNLINMARNNTIYVFVEFYQHLDFANKTIKKLQQFHRKLQIKFKSHTVIYDKNITGFLFQKERDKILKSPNQNLENVLFY